MTKLNTVSESQLLELESDFSNWMTIKEIHEQYPRYSIATLQRLFKRRDEVGLSRCYKRVHKKGMVNIKTFALWMAGRLPGQVE